MIDDRLREIHFGAWEAHRAGEISRLDPDGLQRFWADPLRHPPPGAEPLTAFEARVLSCWEDRLRGHAGGRVLMVTHGGPIRAILGHVYGVPWTDLLGLDLPHASLTHVRVERVRNGIAHAGVVAAPNSA
jgi:broad specificity phosphatase PhoE